MRKYIKIKCSVFFCLILLFANCGSNKKIKEKIGSWEDTAFESYLSSINVSFKKKSNGFVYSDSIKSLYDMYYSDFLENEEKVRLESNEYLKVDKVYVYYRTPTVVDMMIYSNKGSFCLATFSLVEDGFSLPVNGVVKISKPIYITHYGFYNLQDDKIITRKKNRTPFNEWYTHLSGTIKNDTISYIERYKGKDLFTYEKKWSRRGDKINRKEVYQPNLKVERYVNEYNLVYYKVTGEFNMIKTD